MIFRDGEPDIRVGLVEGEKEIEGFLEGPYELDGILVTNVPFRVVVEGGRLVLTVKGEVKGKSKQWTCTPKSDVSTLSLSGVTIGRKFHWERTEKQLFRGTVSFFWDEGALIAVNRLPLEQYLEIVVSSEMSDRAPEEFLKAHAVIARSWAGRILSAEADGSSMEMVPREGEFIRWYDWTGHGNFDVCGDDHCQRYQGIGRMKTGKAAQAVRDTRGLFLIFAGKICDARYHKACGGRTELFSSAWDAREVPYIKSVSCGERDFSAIGNEREAEDWIRSHPPAFCGVKEKGILESILNEYDRETEDFFRWEVTYSREELTAMVKEKSGIDFGRIEALLPLARGPSGRIYRLEIRGSRRNVIVGKELEIRRWLSPTHLLSSAFIVKVAGDTFRIKGAGWGHGVGLCQIGAAVMASLDWDFTRILSHYFPSTSLYRLY
ncbi:MAG: SpoIID/LytB domain-containing protein [Syntrophales bacterium]|nr:SpoIID/LytB domain-containing protein [Syntrophales bacterium]